MCLVSGACSLLLETGSRLLRLEAGFRGSFPSMEEGWFGPAWEGWSSLVLGVGLALC